MSEQIYKFAFSFIKQETRAAARLLEQLDSAEVAEFLSNAPQPLAAGVLKEMLPSVCASVLLDAEFSTAIIWLSELANNHVCAILRHMSKSSQQELLNQLPIRRRTACQLLLTYNSDMLGAWVESDVPEFPGDMSAEEAIKRLKRKSFKEDRIIFVVDEARHPVGTLSISELLRSTKTIPLETILRPNLHVINARMTLSTAISHPLWESCDAAAVVNRSREFIGVIWYSQIRHLLSTQSTLLESDSAAVSDTAMDLFQAYGESMRGLIDVVRKTIG